MASSTNILETLRGVRAVLLDMDGVLYVGNTALPGVQDLLGYLDATGRQWLCVTNNSSRTSATFSHKLAAMDIEIDAGRILGSAEATANWLAQESPHGAKVIMMGEASLRSALEAKGFVLVDDPFAAEIAVASIYFDINYETLTRMTLAIRNGARFVATNPDPTLPIERGQAPGTGSIVALLTASGGRVPEYVGKPFPGMYRQAVERVQGRLETTLMVGDRYETDIEGAARLGMPTAGVLTGVTTRAEFATADPPADVVVEGLPELLALFRQADKG